LYDFPWSCTKSVEATSSPGYVTLSLRFLQTCEARVARSGQECPNPEYYIIHCPEEKFDHVTKLRLQRNISEAAALGFLEDDDQGAFTNTTTDSFDNKLTVDLTGKLAGVAMDGSKEII